MQKNETLEQLCAQLSTEGEQWEEIIRRFRQHIDSSANLNIEQYAMHFSELWLDVCVDRLSEASEGKIRAIGEGDDYGFTITETGRMRVWGSGDEKGLMLCEYDKVIMADGLLVVFEMKMTRQWHGGQRKTKSPSSLGLKYQFRKDVYEKKLSHIMERHGGEVGYVLVIPRDMFTGRDAASTPDSNYSQFKQDNGMVVPFYTDAASFRDEAVKKILENMLPLNIISNRMVRYAG